MYYSELSEISELTGLSYDKECLTLYGLKNGFTVYLIENPTEDELTLLCFADATKAKSSVRQFINDNMESLPKNSINKQIITESCLMLELNRNRFKHGNVFSLIKFLENLTEFCSLTDVATVPVDDEVVSSLQSHELKSKRFKNPKPHVIKGFVGGLIGALIGCIVFVIFAFWNGAILNFAGVITAFLIVFLCYRFSGKKIGVLSVVFCIVLSIVTIYFSTVLVGHITLYGAMNSYETARKSIFDIIENYSVYLKDNPKILNAMVETFIFNVIWAICTNIVFFIWFYYRNTDQMYSENSAETLVKSRRIGTEKNNAENKDDKNAKSE